MIKKHILFFIMLFFIFISNMNFKKNERIHTDDFIEHANWYRTYNHLNTLIYDKKIEEASRIQTMYNYENNACVHYNDEFPTLKDRLNEAQIDDILCYSENIIVIKNVKSLENIEKRIFDEYIKSESHRKNMLLECVNSIGIYTFYDGRDLYSTVVFCN